MPTEDESTGDHREVVQTLVSVWQRCAVTVSQNHPPPSSKLPEADGRLGNTPQLVNCLRLLQAVQSPDDQLDPETQHWLQVIEKDTDEQGRLSAMAIEPVKAFKRDEIKDIRAVAEVVWRQCWTWGLITRAS
ncbi:MAG: hypothetical protein J3Q66DRAFT_373280 [Benniella sp.]|nr:MAG: hypothetical protein J3Q66DRAFT_373280 [Benniella sp.]